MCSVIYPSVSQCLSSSLSPPLSLYLPLYLTLTLTLTLTLRPSFSPSSFLPALPFRREIGSRGTPRFGQRTRQRARQRARGGSSRSRDGQECDCGCVGGGCGGVHYGNAQVPPESNLPWNGRLTGTGEKTVFVSVSVPVPVYIVQGSIVDSASVSVYSEEKRIRGTCIEVIARFSLCAC